MHPFGSFAAFGLLVGHWWHSGRSHAVASRLAFGLSRVYEPVLFLRPVDWSKQDLRLASLVLGQGDAVFGALQCGSTSQGAFATMQGASRRDRYFGTRGAFGNPLV